MSVPDHPRIISEMISRGGEVQPPEGSGDILDFPGFWKHDVLTNLYLYHGICRLKELLFVLATHFSTIDPRRSRDSCFSTKRMTNRISVEYPG